MRNPSARSSPPVRPLAAAVLLGTALLAAEAAAPAAHAVSRSAVVSLGEFGGAVRPAAPPIVRPGRGWAGRASRSADRFRLRSAAVAPVVPVGTGDDVWARLRHCESGGRYDINTGNGFYGAYQFVPRTWRSLGFPGMPHEASPAMQDDAARKLQARSGWGQWPVCSRRIGAR
ncbi:MAG TPA: transglycosylase family protein [Acidimicrobiia bacterium]|jgi:hypothetical protein